MIAIAHNSPRLRFGCTLPFYLSRYVCSMWTFIVQLRIYFEEKLLYVQAREPKKSSNNKQRQRQCVICECGAEKQRAQRKEVSKMKTHSHTISCLLCFFYFTFYFLPFFSPFFVRRFYCLLCFIAAFHEHMFLVSSILMPFACAVLCIWLVASFRLLFSLMLMFARALSLLLIQRPGRHILYYNK